MPSVKCQVRVRRVEFRSVMVLGALLSVGFACFVEVVQKRAMSELVCGFNVDHGTEIVYESAEGTQWRCTRCHAEGWKPRLATE